MTYVFYHVNRSCFYRLVLVFIEGEWNNIKLVHNRKGYNVITVLVQALGSTLNAQAV